ncbi:MAG: LacI family DNA-binding transcriptional regulator [Saccharofermentanales bacterium]
MSGKKVSAQEIARKVGCSPSTVSRALNDKAGISEEVRTEIRIKAIEMGYDLQSVHCHQTRKTGNSVKLVSIIVTRDNFADENFFRKIIREIEQVLFKKGIGVNFSIIEKEDEMVLSMLKRLHPDGAIVFGLLSKKSITDAVFGGYPIVLVDTPNMHLKVDRITINNYLGCYESASYLMEEGHKRITFIGDTSFSDSIMERYEGSKDYVVSHGGTWIDSDGTVKMEMSGQVTIDQQKFESLLGSRTPPTAVICANDRIALELYKVLSSMGKSVPDDLSVIGFDNIDKSKWSVPPLSTVNVPKLELGQESVRMLLDRILCKEKVTSLLRLDTNLVIRESVRKITT